MESVHVKYMYWYFHAQILSESFLAKVQNFWSNLGGKMKRRKKRSKEEYPSSSSCSGWTSTTHLEMMTILTQTRHSCHQTCQECTQILDVSWEGLWISSSDIILYCHLRELCVGIGTSLCFPWVPGDNAFLQLFPGFYICSWEHSQGLVFVWL